MRNRKVSIRKKKWSEGKRKGGLRHQNKVMLRGQPQCSSKAMFYTAGPTREGPRVACQGFSVQAKGVQVHVMWASRSLCKDPTVGVLPTLFHTWKK